MSLLEVVLPTAVLRNTIMVKLLWFSQIDGFQTSFRKKTLQFLDDICIFKRTGSSITFSINYDFTSAKWLMRSNNHDCWKQYYVREKSLQAFIESQGGQFSNPQKEVSISYPHGSFRRIVVVNNSNPHWVRQRIQTSRLLRTIVPNFCSSLMRIAGALLRPVRYLWKDKSKPRGTSWSVINFRKTWETFIRLSRGYVIQTFTHLRSVVIFLKWSYLQWRHWRTDGKCPYRLKGVHSQTPNCQASVWLRQFFNMNFVGRGCDSRSPLLCSEEQYSRCSKRHGASANDSWWAAWICSRSAIRNVA